MLAWKLAKTWENKVGRKLVKNENKMTSKLITKKKERKKEKEQNTFLEVALKKKDRSNVNKWN